jgi:hypothetical protein
MLANAGVPMLALHLPAMVVLLVPIIAIEVLVARRLIPLTTSRLIRGVAGANVVSTLIGIPLTWALMLVLNIVTTGTEAKGIDTLSGQFASVVLQSSWLVPYEADLDWMIPAATLVLLVPYFFASVIIEQFALKKIWKADVPTCLSAFVWQANGLTYGLLGLGTVLLWQALR